LEIERLKKREREKEYRRPERKEIKRKIQMYAYLFYRLPNLPVLASSDVPGQE
jgi:hypothetical protein